MELNHKKETQPSYAEFLKRQGMIKCTNCLQYTSKGNYCEQCGCRLTTINQADALGVSLDDLRGGTEDGTDS